MTIFQRIVQSIEAYLLRLLAPVLALPYGDKIAHAILGALYGLVVFAITGSTFATTVLTAAAAAYWEWRYNKSQPGRTVSVVDFLATVGGWVALWILIAIFT